MTAFILRSVRLFRLISWYYLRRHPLRTILLLSVLMVGVAAMFTGAASLPLGERAVAAAFDLTAGRARIVVYPGTVPGAAVTKEDLRTVRRTAGVETAAPLLQSGGLVLAQNELLVFWGIDPAVERDVREYGLEQGGFIERPGQVMFSAAYAREKGFSIGQQISLAGPGGVYAFTLVGTLAAEGIATLNGGDLAVLDYTDALALAGTDSLSSIAVVPEDGQDAAGLIERLQSALSDAVSVGRPASFRKSPTDFISQALQFNSGLMVMVLGALMITGTLASSIAQRRSEIGVLRALGLTRPDIRNLFLGESGSLGILGSLAGILLGYQIKSVMPPWMPSDSLSAPVDPAVPVWITLLVFFMAVGIVLLASLLPARQAARLDPIDAILRPRIDADGARFGRLSIVIGLSLLVGLSVLRLLVDNSENVVILPLVAELAVLAGGALLLPPLIAALSRRLPPLMTRLFGASGLLAAESLAKRPRRMVITAIIVFGTVWTFSTGIGVDRSTSAFLDRWLDYESVWQVTVSGPGEDANHPIAGIPSKIAEEIAARPDVATAVRERFAILSYQNRDYCLWAVDIEPFDTLGGRLSFEQGEPAAAFGRLRDHARPALLVGGYQALLDGLKQIGKTVTLDFPGGSVEFEIAGVVNFQPETSSAAGSAAFFVIDRPLYLKLWGDGRVDRMRLALAPGADPAAVRRDLLRSFAAAGILVTDHPALRAAAKSPGIAFGALAYGLLPFMMLGIANTLFIAVLDRRREIGLLRALGVLRGQIAGSIVLEVLIVIGIASVVGIPAGYYMVDVMLYGRIVGIPIQPDTAGVIIVAAGTLMAGILAAWFPARQASRLDVLDALHYE